MQTLRASTYTLARVVTLLVLIQLSTSERCGYRVFSSGSKTRHRLHDEYLPTEIVFKECPWGCCWDQKENVCCLFPMDVVVFAFIATLAAIVVVTLVIILLCYVHVRRNRNAIDPSSPVVRQSEYLKENLLSVV
ncbi:unnamed protein product [Lymnaea stagnalis]|uniref:Uncharacterized protein n=1 Tax=Lymnaea stagnalis TaxID=6523 RepID=A0AAV2HI40_LYMST